MQYHNCYPSRDARNLIQKLWFATTSLVYRPTLFVLLAHFLKIQCFFCESFFFLLFFYLFLLLFFYKQRKNVSSIIENRAANQLEILLHKHAHETASRRENITLCSRLTNKVDAFIDTKFHLSCPLYDYAVLWLFKFMRTE